jgi:hypothetical protein
MDCKQQLTLEEIVIISHIANLSVAIQACLYFIVISWATFRIARRKKRHETVSVDQVMGLGF